MSNKAVILADGQFPQHNIPLDILKSTTEIICCDGATVKLFNVGIEPKYIVGDLDSIPSDLKLKYADRLHHFPDQDTNDLTKAINFCIDKNYDTIYILGATGLREDHTLGNISLLLAYAIKGINVLMLTDFGTFTPLLSSGTFQSYKGQQISIFQLTSDTLITTKGLMYPIENRSLLKWWQGTLNEALSDSFEISFDKGELIVFQTY
ncbi:MAG: thiamine diphosphokinase [Bacteroidota bacterium]